MPSDLAHERQQAHSLLDLLPVEKLAAVRNLLEVMVGPTSQSVTSAPVDEKEIAPEIAVSLEHARASLARGEGIPHEDVLREFGVKK